MILVWILVAVSSGSVFCSSFFKKRWEEAVPATVFSMILVLYTFALLDILKAGVAVLTVMIAGLYIAAAIKIIRDHSYRAFIRNTFTPAFFVFILLFLACFWATKGMVAVSYTHLRCAPVRPALSRGN